MAGNQTDTITMTVTETRYTYKYRCKVTDQYGKSVNSTSAKLVRGTAQTELAITAQPTDQTGSIGDVATFTVTAQGEGLTYQWQWYNGSKWQDTTQPGYDTDSFSQKITEARLAYQYRCVVTDRFAQVLRSDAARLVRSDA